MSRRRRRQFYAVCLLLLLGALAEIVAIGSVVPFLAILADPAAAERIPLLGSVGAALGADTRYDQLLVISLLFVAAAIVSGALRLLLARQSQDFVFNLGHDLGVEIQRRILSQPYYYHVSHNTSEIVSSLEKVNILVFSVLLQIMLSATAAIISIFIVAALVYIDPLIASITAASFAAMYLAVSAFTSRRLAHNSAVAGSAYAQRVQMIQESLGGIRDIIIDHSQAVYLESFSRIDKRLNVARASTSFIGIAPRFVIESGGLVLIAALAIFMVDQEGGLAGAVPVLGALALGAQRLLPLVQQVYQGWSSVAGNRAVVEDVMALLSLPAPSEADEAGPVRPLPFASTIRFEQVSFLYDGRSDPALSEVSLTVPRGSKVALIGKTGSGKSTLIDLLMGLLQPTSGRITIDGVPLNKDAARSWQATIAHVPQTIFLADTSIERNIAFGLPAHQVDRARVVDASRRAQLHGFIETLPEGYDTPVGERGVRLSGGQRQRLGIARALYKAAPVLVLDEATSALDDETETAVIRSLERLSERPTIFMIAHRLTTIANCDLVVRLDGGRVVEVGTFEQVVAPLAS